YWRALRRNKRLSYAADGGTHSLFSQPAVDVSYSPLSSLTRPVGVSNHFPHRYTSQQIDTTETALISCHWSQQASFYRVTLQLCSPHHRANLTSTSISYPP